MFNGFAKTETKLAVLEERLTSYETVMNKIDEAIQIMGKTSQNISKMLAVHEEKLDHGEKSDASIIRMISELREENKSEHTIVMSRVKDLETKIDEVIKFRWLVAGGIILATFIISQSSIVVDILTPDPQPVRMESPK